jgi:hypothetical protein
MTDPIAGSDLSRRSLVKTAATAAAVGGALVLAGPASGAEAAAVPAQTTASGTTEHGPATGEGVLVRVIDARLGTLEVYTGHGHRTVTDRALAAQLVRLVH